jgi:hypothetical protein
VITAYADQTFKRVDPNVVTGIVRKPFEMAELGNVVRLCIAGIEEVSNKTDETKPRARPGASEH